MPSLADNAIHWPHSEGFAGDSANEFVRFRLEHIQRPQFVDFVLGLARAQIDAVARLGDLVEEQIGIVGAIGVETAARHEDA